MVNGVIKDTKSWTMTVDPTGSIPYDAELDFENCDFQEGDKLLILVTASDYNPSNNPGIWFSGGPNAILVAEWQYNLN